MKPNFSSFVDYFLFCISVFPPTFGVTRYILEGFLLFGTQIVWLVIGVFVLFEWHNH